MVAVTLRRYIPQAYKERRDSLEIKFNMQTHLDETVATTFIVAWVGKNSTQVKVMKQYSKCHTGSRQQIQNSLQTL